MRRRSVGIEQNKWRGGSTRAKAAAAPGPCLRRREQLFGPNVAAAEAACEAETGAMLYVAHFKTLSLRHGGVSDAHHLLHRGMASLYQPCNKAGLCVSYERTACRGAAACAAIDQNLSPLARVYIIW